MLRSRAPPSAPLPVCSGIGLLGDSSEVAPIGLSPGDIFALITDGFFEYEDSAGEEYGKDRLGQAVRQHAHLTPPDLIKTICTGE